MKIPPRLQPLVEEGIVQSVVRPLQSGKEAQLYIVLAEGGYCVAKVYKEAQHRSFKHRAGYTEGRQVRNSRQRRAMEKSSRYGRSQLEAAWQNAEVDALYALSSAGLRVPRPHLFLDGVLLMDLILDPDGQPAPRLWDVEFTEEEAVELHRFLVHQAVLMLCEGMVHGDFSEYNILLAWDGPVIIDLPQAVDAAHNPNAKKLFLRDLENITSFLARFAPQIASTQYGPEIWSLYERAKLFPDTPLTGRHKGSERKADTRAVLREIEAAARDARRAGLAPEIDEPEERDDDEVAGRGGRGGRGRVDRSDAIPPKREADAGSKGRRRGRGGEGARDGRAEDRGRRDEGARAGERGPRRDEGARGDGGRRDDAGRGDGGREGRGRRRDEGGGRADPPGPGAGANEGRGRRRSRSRRDDGARQDQGPRADDRGRREDRGRRDESGAGDRGRGGDRARRDDSKGPAAGRPAREAAPRDLFDDLDALLEGSGKGRGRG